MIPVEEQYGFEISAEVADKIERAEDLHKLIGEEEFADLQQVKETLSRYRYLKRAMDAFLAACGLLVLLIPMLIIAIAIFIDDPGKVLFRQYRVGRNGKRFRIYKFRTMKQNTPKYLSTMEVEDPERYITRLGSFLRKTSLDELPQLFNVLIGDMSLVGPRPLISDEYEIHQMRMRFGVYQLRPGVTGLAQVNGRDAVEPAEKVRYDVKYLQSYGLSTDLKILFSTIPNVILRRGVVEGQQKK